MKKYLVCEDVCSDDVIFVVTEQEDCEKDDLVVLMEYDEPGLARVKGFIGELEAITGDRVWFEALSVVSVKEYYLKRKKEAQKARLVKLMKDQMDLQKLEDTLKKNSECNSAMASLYDQYKSLCESE